MEAVKKKWFWGIFISILTIFAMSHNASAITTVLDLTNYSLVRSGTWTTNCEFTGSFNISSSGACAIRPTGNVVINTIQTNNNYDSKAGDLFHFYLFIYTDQYNIENEPRLTNFSYQTQNYSVIQYQEVSYSKYNEDMISYGGYINWSPNNDFSINFETYNGFYKIYEITLRSDVDGTRPVGLYGGAAGLYVMNFNQVPGVQITYALKSFSQWRPTESKENKEVEEKTQEAVDDSEAAGGTSSQDAQTGTTGLLNAITGAVSVISSATPTNCKINGNMGNLDMGQLDLCANPAPAFIQTIGSLILILMCVPLAISLFNRFIAIFRSFQS